MKVDREKMSDKKKKKSVRFFRYLQLCVNKQFDLLTFFFSNLEIMFLKIFHIFLFIVSDIFANINRIIIVIVILN